jgi:hypothetical protein
MLRILAFLTVLLSTLAFHSPSNAYDGLLHAFANDDRKQFVDVWLNRNSTITIKASNGRANRRMAIVVTVFFHSPLGVVGQRNYTVWCPAPDGGLLGAGIKGKECWFENLAIPPNMGFLSALTLATHKDG